ncbi:uncharacterized protein [Oryza sativa Japonica Group]|uniref:uncharacterized protein n=1 Tax=Oryza sativa subsp. japonica TaxID=39947 RepID=UPI0007753EEC|nr:formin-like protein 5 [Oryza sativa Japonica Group]
MTSFVQLQAAACTTPDATSSPTSTAASRALQQRRPVAPVNRSNLLLFSPHPLHAASLQSRGGRRPPVARWGAAGSHPPRSCAPLAAVIPSRGGASPAATLPSRAPPAAALPSRGGALPATALLPPSRRTVGRRRPPPSHRAVGRRRLTPSRRARRRPLPFCREVGRRWSPPSRRAVARRRPPPSSRAAAAHSPLSQAPPATVLLSCGQSPIPSRRCAALLIKLILVLLLSAVEFGWVQNASGRAEGTIVAIGGGGGEIGIGRQLLEHGACVDEEAVKDIGGEAELRENQATLLLPVAVPRASASHEVDVEVDFASESGAAGVDGRRQGDELAVLHGIELQLILCSAAEEGVVKGEDVHDVLHAPLFLRHWHRPSCTPTTNCSQN